MEDYGVINCCFTPNVQLSHGKNKLLSNKMMMLMTTL